MRLFGMPDNGPLMNSDRGLSNPKPEMLSGARYQIVPGPRGLPMAQIALNFRRDIPAVANPDMTLAVLLDRSGSMSEAFREGHVTNVATAIFNHAAAAGVGYDLVFYDDQVSDAGPMRTVSEVQSAVRMHPPRGGTTVTSALRTAIKKYHTRPGMYIIVITDGEFGDKVQVQQYIVQELLPQVTPENPYAYRLHFVGAGEGVDHAFLRQIEAAATGQGVSMVTQHHHAHLSHSHASIFDTLDTAFIGVGLNARFGDFAQLAGGTSDAGSSPITHTMDSATRRTWDGAVGELGFLPRRALLGCEYAPTHPETLRIAVQFQGRSQHGVNQLVVPVPLPKQGLTTPPPTLAPSKKSGFHLPWIHKSPEQEAARAEQERQKAELAHLTATNRQTELQRQTQDIQALSQGGIPTLAAARLKEIGNAGGGEGVLFTSDLSPEEAGLLRREGFRVRGLVSGSAMYHVGQAYASSQGDVEVSVLSNAYDEATRLAVARMRQELTLIGAHGVVGVRLSLVRHEWADKTVEVQAIGTAVDGPGPVPKEPWLSDLSGQEWWALHRAGYVPATLVWGYCAWFVLTTQNDEWAERSWTNQEMTHWSAALGRARHRAMANVTRQAKNHAACGIAGVKMDRRLDEVRLSGPGEDPAYEREHHNLVVSIVGTAIKLRPDAPSGVTPTTHVLSLRDGVLSPVALGAADAKIE
jgi:uncharacterized protein YbjQ (UPF0145 family)